MLTTENHKSLDQVKISGGTQLRFHFTEYVFILDITNTGLQGFLKKPSADAIWCVDLDAGETDTLAAFEDFLTLSNLDNDRCSFEEDYRYTVYLETREASIIGARLEIWDRAVAPGTPTQVLMQDMEVSFTEIE